jgi:ketosteroid isomerase-like protein
MVSRRRGDSLRADATEVVDAIELLFNAIKQKDIRRIQERYLHDERLMVFLEGPEKIEGFDQASNEAAWRALLDAITFTDLELAADLRAGRDHDLGWVGASIRMTYTALDGSSPTSVESRGTWVLERDEDAWRIVFEHVSLPASDPYPLPGSGSETSKA